jgi:hypothetical protein
MLRPKCDAPFTYAPQLSVVQQHREWLRDISLHRLAFKSRNGEPKVIRRTLRDQTICKGR